MKKSSVEAPGRSYCSAPSEASITVRLLWMDWQSDELSQFDLQEFLEFCGVHLAGPWGVGISNAVGGARTTRVAAPPAVVSLTLSLEADLAAVGGSRFGSLIMARSDALPGGIAVPDRSFGRPLASKEHRPR